MIRRLPEHEQQASVCRRRSRLRSSDVRRQSVGGESAPECRSKAYDQRQGSGDVPGEDAAFRWYYHQPMRRLSCAPSHKGSAHHPLVAAVRRTLTAALTLLVLGALGTVGGAHSASAATVSCDTPSLISAITTANGTPGGSTLVLPTGCVYTLASANNATDGGTGLPVITGNVTIQGARGHHHPIERHGRAGLPHLRRGQRWQPDLRTR